jgi:hypothetical protein
MAALAAGVLAVFLPLREAQAADRSHRVLLLRGYYPYEGEVTRALIERTEGSPAAQGMTVEDHHQDLDQPLERRDGKDVEGAPPGDGQDGHFTREVLSRFDTVVFSQRCAISKQLTEADKRRLFAWVAEGHKLIVYDSDPCAHESTPDYSFFPIPFAIDAPGARGAPSQRLDIVEKGALGTSDRRDPVHFVDLERWRTTPNDLGDANIIVTKSKGWCGHLFGVNVDGVAGFNHAYSRHGRGLIIYNGLDLDDVHQEAFGRLAMLELLQPFDPDGLPCSVSVTKGFVVSSAAADRVWPLRPGGTLELPLGIYPHGGYQGEVKLTVEAAPPMPGVRLTVEPSSVAIGAKGATGKLIVAATPEAKIGEHTLTVRGRDASGSESAVLFKLRAGEGTITVSWGELEARQDSELPTGPRKVELILDCSGSMAEKLAGKGAGGGKTKMDVARAVLRELIAKLPPGLEVGLRAYGHRFRKGPKACTDTELLVPPAPLDRARILAAVDALAPRGETPMVYSALEARKDFADPNQAAVILVTDGIESCKGSVAELEKSYREAGSLKLNVIGFGIRERKLEGQIRKLAAATGGGYYAAGDAAALSRAFAAALGPRGFVVERPDGTEAARGSLGETVEVPPGTYRVAVAGVSDQLLVVPSVKVSAGDQIELELAAGEKGPLLRRRPVVFRPAFGPQPEPPPEPQTQPPPPQPGPEEK